MNEQVFAELLKESYRQEFSQYDSSPVFKTSGKHNRAMKRIFKIYKKNVQKLHTNSIPAYTPKPMHRLSLKAISIAILVAFLAVLAGCAVAYFISQNFHGEITSDSTNILPINTENCPATIEEIYNISDVPEGFEKISDNSDPFSRTVEYMNSLTKQMIVFSQYSKPGLGTLNLNTEKNKLEEVKIDRYKGIFIEQSDENSNYCIIIWDNGDYIFEIFANLTKEEVIDLANTTKL